jgi:hypothetical protein
MADARSPVDRKDSTHPPEPPQVRDGRDRKLADDRRAAYSQELRPYYCRTCGAEQRSALVPRGWYSLTRASGSTQEKPQRLGVYCSIICIDRQMPRLVGIEADLGERFADAPSPFRQVGRP